MWLGILAPSCSLVPLTIPLHKIVLAKCRWNSGFLHQRHLDLHDTVFCSPSAPSLLLWHQYSGGSSFPLLDDHRVGKLMEEEAPGLPSLNSRTLALAGGTGGRLRRRGGSNREKEDKEGTTGCDGLSIHLKFVEESRKSGLTRICCHTGCTALQHAHPFPIPRVWDYGPRQALHRWARMSRRAACLDAARPHH